MLSTILIDLIFRRNHGRRTAIQDPPLNLRSSQARAKLIQNRHNTFINWLKVENQAAGTGDRHIAQKIHWKLQRLAWP